MLNHTVNHTVKIVYDALRQGRTVTVAIYKALKEAGLTVNGVKR
jgi:hypothetical protein